MRSYQFASLLALGLFFTFGFGAGAQSQEFKVCLNVFILADTETELEQGAQFPNPEALLGEPDPSVRSLIETVIARVESIWMQCQIGFSVNIIKVIRSSQLIILGRPLLDYLDFPETALAAIQVALEALREEFKRQGLKISRYKCLQVFVGNLERMVEQGAAGTATGPGDVISMAHWKRIGGVVSTILIIAHEIGHNLSLWHVSNPRNLMSSGGRGNMNRLEPEQCVTARKTAAELVFGRPPQIVRILFPPEIPANGTEAAGLVIFEDRDGDVKLIRFEVVEGDLKPFAFDPQVSWIRFGEIRFSLVCHKPQLVTLRVTLVDEAEHVSDPVAFSFKCM